MEVEVPQKEPKKQSNTSTIWRTLLESFSIENLPLYCNPMLDTLDPKILELIDNLSTQPIYDDKSLEMVPLDVEKEQKGAYRKR